MHSENIITCNKQQQKNQLLPVLEHSERSILFYFFCILFLMFCLKIWKRQVKNKNNQKENTTTCLQIFVHVLLATYII